MPRGAKRDNTETAARNFDDERSFVSLEGHEYLARGSKEWNMRKRHVFDRDGFKCQWKPLCKHICGAAAEHIHHILPRGRGGSDDLDNLMAICREHHKIAHPEKQLRWTRRKHAGNLP